MKSLAVFLVAAAPAFGANAQLMNLVMPDAKVVAGLNVTSAKASPLGQYLIKQVPSGFPSIPGFDPLTDVTDIVAASTGAPKTGLIAMAGTFDPSKIIQPTWTTSQYDGATLVTFPQGTAAFIGTTIAIAGDPVSVKAAIDRSGGANVTALDPALAAQIASLSGSNDAWIASIVSPAVLVPANAAGQMAQPMQLLAAVQSFTATAKFDQTVPINITLVADTPQDAEALGNVAKLLVSMMGTNGPAALQNLQVNVSGTTAQLSLNIPESQIEAMLTPKAKTN